jgi:hypothetical protein
VTQAQLADKSVLQNLRQQQETALVVAQVAAGAEKTKRNIMAVMNVQPEVMAMPTMIQIPVIRFRETALPVRIVLTASSKPEMPVAPALVSPAMCLRMDGQVGRLNTQYALIAILANEGLCTFIVSFLGVCVSQPLFGGAISFL